VFGPKVGQQEVFDVLAMPLVDVVLGGFNATVFAYGQTGSGKTHTMLGEPGQPGIMGRTLTSLFSSGARATFNVSFIELYNEEIRDLLNPGAQSGSGPGLDLREDPLRGPQVAGVTYVACVSPDEVMALVHEGNGRRRTEGTAANPVSSRSHAVLQVLVEQGSGAGAGPGPGAGRRGARNAQGPPAAARRGGGRGRGAQVACSKLSLIDLAGSERAANTENRGQRLVEGAMINRSLLALGNCINALSKKGMYVNFRDSKLTRLLKDSLGGNTRTAMIAHVSPSASSFEESLNTLKYAHRARSITSEVRISWQPAKRKYGDELSDVRAETTRLREQLERTAPAEPSPQPRAAKKGRGPREAERCKEKAPATERATPARTGPSDAAAAPAPRAPLGPSRDPPAALASTIPSDVDSDVDSGDENGAAGGGVLAGLDVLKATTREVVGHLRDQTALKQSLMELDDQNVRNRIEISKIAVSLIDKGSGKCSGGSSGGGDDDADELAAAERGANPKERERRARKQRKAKKDVHALKKAIAGNVAKREELRKELKEAEQSLRPAEAKLASLMAEVEAKTRDAAAAKGVASKVQARLAAAEHEVSLLEVQKLELEQAAVASEAGLRARDLALHKVQLQVDLRDAALNLLVNALAKQPAAGGGGGDDGLDVKALLLGLAVGPVEGLFNALAVNVPAAPPAVGKPRSGQAAAGDDSDASDGEDDRNDLAAVDGRFKDLSMSLRRGQKLPGGKQGAVGAMRGEGKSCDSGDEDGAVAAASSALTPGKKRRMVAANAAGMLAASLSGESKGDDGSGSELDESDFSGDYDDDEDDEDGAVYDDEFEAEPELTSPVPKDRRPPRD